MSDEPIHLQGMGVLGSLMAWKLFNQEIPFTWDDNDSPGAWKASTGCVYPSGDEEAELSLETWKHWVGNPPWDDMIENVVEPAMIWYNTKTHPHGLKMDAVTSVGSLNCAKTQSVHVDVNKLVSETQRNFSPCREEPLDPDVITHGFGSRLYYYGWGWAAEVHLRFPDEVLRRSDGLRPMLSLFKNRFQRGYAYPLPGRDTYLVGSSTVKQSEPKEREVETSFERWKEMLNDTTNGEVEVVDVLGFTQGWRPYKHKEDTFEPVLEDGVVVMPSCGPNGVRLGPKICDKAIEMLGEEPPETPHTPTVPHVDEPRNNPGQVTVVFGVPSSGKSSTATRVVESLDDTGSVEFKEGLVFGEHYPVHNLYVFGNYRSGDEFAGTDKFSFAAMTDVDAMMQKHSGTGTNFFIEGDRLASGRLHEIAKSHGYDVKFIGITASEDIIQKRREARSNDPSEKWLKTRYSKVDNLLEKDYSMELQNNTPEDQDRNVDIILGLMGMSAVTL